MFVSKWEKESKNIRKQEVRETTYSSTILDDKRYFRFKHMVQREVQLVLSK